MANATHTRSTSSIAKVATASFIGTLIEYFDFFLFGTAAALIFNKVFFPNLDPLIGTLAAFGTFGAAFLARPLGGFIFGHYGDRLGRKTMLVLSLLLMGFATLSVGLMPTYAQVGVLAPVLLVISRLIQGVAIGGEWSGAVLMAVEHAPPSKRAFYGSWPQCGVPAGLVLATGCFYLVQLLPQDDMMSWGWRVPFIASALLVILGMYIRLKIAESPEFEAVKERKEEVRLPVAYVMRSAWRSVLVSMMSMAAPNIIFYVATVFALKYGSETLGMPRSTILGAVCLASFIQVFTMPMVAIAADRYGTRAVLMFGSLMTMLGAYPFFWLIDTAQTLNVYLAMILALPLLHATTFGPLASFIPDQFEARVRYTGSAVGYHIGGMTHSGPVPFVAAAMFAWAGDSWPLALYIGFGGLVTLVALACMRSSNQPVATQEAAPSKSNLRSSTVRG
ncbi:MHS family MFS transporter [Pseudomonas veronii]|jgi:metabolite-proton symporter|uniref:MHS family MFS transporter n=1 Tax=Pseudomonas veronii TaxID=76761 RepID=A0A7Y1AA77_PSEVE|nr:MFS transporter [Pseudomonas veronii]NMY11907.1 MHS family MFS transporter [Pseudomonas veronii]